MEQSVAKGYIELDISNMKTAVASAVSELNKIDRAGELAQSEMNKLKSVSQGVGTVFQQAAEKSKVLSQGIEQAKSKAAVYKQEIDALNKIIERSKEAQGQLSAKIQDISGKYDKSQEKVKSLSTAYNAAQREIKAVTKEYGENSAQAQEVANKNKSIVEAYEKASSSSEKYRNELVQLKGKHEALGLQVQDSGQSVVEFKTKLNNTEASINKMSRELAEASSKAIAYGQSMRSAGETLQTWGNGINSIGNKMTLGITTPLVAAGTASVKLASDSATSFAKVSTIADETVLSYDRMKSGVTKASNDTGVAITDFNEALYQSLSAGVDTGKAIGFTTDMVKLARGGFTDTAKAVDVVTSVLNAYGMSADQASSVSDKLVLTQKIGKTTVDELASSLGRIIPSAKATNFDINNVSTGMAILTKRGIQTAEATTYFNGMLNELGKSGSEADGVLRELAGKGFSQMMAEGVPLTEILGMLSDYATQNGKSLSDMFGSMEAGKAALSIMSDGGAEYNQVLEQMKNSTGEAQAAFDKMDATPAVKMQKEFNKLKIAGIEAGTQLMPVAIQGVKLIGDLAEEFSKLSPEAQKSILKMLGFAAAAGPVLKVVGSTTKGIGGLTKGIGGLVGDLGKISAAKRAAKSIGEVGSFSVKAVEGVGGLSKALFALANPVTFVVAGMGALAGGMYLADKAQKAYIESLGQLTGKEKELADSINEQHDAYKEMDRGREKSLSGIDAEFTKTQNLANELRTLVDENGRVKAGSEERAAFITGQLSSALGQEISITDGVIQNYGELCSSIDETIRMQRALAVQEALQADYVEAVQKQSEAQKNYNKELENAEKYKRKLEEAEKDLTAVGEKYKDANMENKAIASQAAEEHAKAAENVAKYSGKLENTKDALKKAEEAMIGYNQTIQNYDGLGAAIQSRDAEQINAALLKIQEGFLTAETATQKSLTAQNKAIQEKYKDMQQAVKEGAPGVTQEAVDAMGRLAERATAELNAKTEQEKTALSNMFRQCGIEAPQELINGLAEKTPEAQAALNDMLNSMSTGTSLKKEELKSLLKSCGVESANSLAAALDGQKPEVQMKALELLMQLQNADAAKRPEIISQFQSMGPDASAAIIAGFSQAGISGKLNEESQKDLQSFISGFSSLESETQTVWAQAWFGALKGLAGFEKLSDPAKEGVDAFLESLKDALEVHSPSEATRRIFSQVWPGASSGLDEGQEGMATKGRSVITTFLDSLVNEMDGGKQRLKDSASNMGNEGHISLQQAFMAKTLMPPGVNDINGVSNTIGLFGNAQMGIGLKNKTLTPPGVNDINGVSGIIGLWGNNQMGSGLVSRNLNPPTINDLEASSKASKARGDMQGYFDRNPLSVMLNIVKSVAGAMAGFANGGIATEASIFGEDGPEMAIPLSRAKRSRAIDLFNETSRLLGISPEESAMRTEMLNTLATSQRAFDNDKFDFEVSVPEIDYDLLADKIAIRMEKAFKNAPISPVFKVEDGPVYFDNEKVGRKQAPVISRIMSKNM